MQERIARFENLAAISRLIMNTRLEVRTRELMANIIWLGYYTDAEDARAHANRVGTHRHSFHEVHLCLSGQCTYQAGEGRCTIGTGDMIFFRANESHCLLSKSPDFGKVALGFELLEQGELTARLNQVFLQQPVTVSTQTETLMQLFYRILDEFGQQRLGYLAAADALLLQVILELGRLSEQGDARPADFNRRSDQRIAEINRFIEENMNRRLTCEELADSLHMSVRQLNRVVQKEFNRSLSEYVDSVKLEKAKSLLLYSDEPVSRIACSLGYASEFSFGKFFKRVEGLSPGRFRASRLSYKD